jgi:hypothetical protein
MNQSHFSNRLLRAAVVMAVIGLLGYAITRQRAGTGSEPPVADKNARHLSSVTVRNHQPASTNAPDRVLTLDPAAVLASVNGRSLTACEVLPPGTSSRPVSMQVCQYYLQRAINRELIFQTAKAQGIGLNDSQKQQILDFKTMRAQPGPGTIRDLNGGSAEIAFESQDAAAFMLQTSLMDRAGASPNVTAEQVAAYYQQHSADFGELPADTQARAAAWKTIDYQIREILAPGIRSDFQNRLADYMNQLKAKADIQLTPLSSLAAAN